MSRDKSRIYLLRALAVFAMAMGLSVSALAQSVPFPTYQLGQNQNGSQGPDYPSTFTTPWVVSSGQIITPAGTPVYLGITTRAKAIAFNPHTTPPTPAILQMGAPQSVTVFNALTGAILQNFSPPLGNHSGSTTGIAYSPNGAYLVFSQDGLYGPAYVSIASVNLGTGMLSNYAQVSVPLDANGGGNLTTVTCYPYNAAATPPSGSPPGTTGSIAIPCGQTVSLVSDGAPTSYPMGIAISPDGLTAYVVLDNNDTLTKIDLTAPKPLEGPEIRVGNVPHSVVISPDGTTAYVSNEGGRIATAKDFQGYSNGTPVVVDNPTGATSTGTISVVNLARFAVTGSIGVGLHPTGMALYGTDLLVANAYSDSISMIDTSTNKVTKTIELGLPIKVPGSLVGAGPNSIAVDAVNGIAYVALYNANAIAVINLSSFSLSGLIPVGYAPSSVVLDATDGNLLVANDKGIGTTGFGVAPPPTNTAENSYGKEFGVYDFNTHQDLGTVNIVPIPNSLTLSMMTTQVYVNNHWDLAENILSASGGKPTATPVAIPARIGSPSVIKHVFVIIRENRTYDQILGDVVGGNGDPTLATFGDGTAASSYGIGPDTPNAHTLVQRFPLLDNFYDPSRQSADGHNWITQAMAPYSDDVQSPDWLRDYPSNGGEALAYQKVGHLWDVAVKAGVTFKNYGEYIEYNTFNPPQGCTAPPGAASNYCEPLWIDFFNDITAYECGAETQLYNENTVASHSPLPNLINHTFQTYPQFDLGIPDQFRFDIWNQDFQNDINNGTVPQLEFMWISSDHTGGPPPAQVMQADNDLALGRFVDAISHSSIWSSSAIFIEEDDAQTGVDHVDGHRSPGYVVSPYVKQRVNPDGTGAGVIEDSTFYTQVNMTRTIEQILGLKPMNQFDLTASPMLTLFIDNPPANNFLPWTHVPAAFPLNTDVTQTPTQTAIPACPAPTTAVKKSIRNESPAIKALRAGWMAKKAEVFAGKYHTPDSEDSDTVNHLNWYESTGFMRPYPGEKIVRPASDFNKPAPTKADNDD
ncbi:MAG: bifunctional YncE family protein/alkaline phosphatase family protein [Candidatus Sulfotelmatobacter sp.]